MNNINDDLLKTLISTVQSTSESIQKLTDGVNKLVISEERRIVQDEHNQKEMERLETKIDKVNNDLDKYVPVLIKAEEWQKMRAGMLKAIGVFVICGVLAAFYKFK